MNFTIHFGMGGRQEPTDMLFGDVTMKATSDGKQFLEYSERETKTRKGESGNTRAFAPKMFEVPGDARCPVRAFKEYVQRKPAETLKPSSRMYLTPLRNIIPDSSDLHNHSARKTTLTSLLHSKVEATQIMQLTGHRNVQSINQYSCACIDQQKTMSDILSNISSRNRVVSNTDISNNSDVTQKPSISTSSFPVNTETSSDDELANVDFYQLTSSIENYERENQAPINRDPLNTNSINTDNRPTVIDLSPILPTFRFCLLPYAKIGGNVTINLYGQMTRSKFQAIP